MHFCGGGGAFTCKHSTQPLEGGRLVEPQVRQDHEAVGFVLRQRGSRRQLLVLAGSAPAKKVQVLCQRRMYWSCSLLILFEFRLVPSEDSN